MKKIYQRSAKEVKLQSYLIKGMEHHGLLFFFYPDDNIAGGQCKECNTIVWFNPRLHPIITEKQPNNIPSSGEVYRKYYQEKIKRVLFSLPPCPCCGNSNYDKSINNSTIARFKDGFELNNLPYNTEIINVNQDSIKVWWIEY